MQKKKKRNNLHYSFSKVVISGFKILPNDFLYFRGGKTYFHFHKNKLNPFLLIRNTLEEN